MEHREVTIQFGQVFDVPNHIVRLDGRKTHAWQVRYGKPWKAFSDHTPDGSGAAASLKLAIDELAKRINRLPAPNRTRTDVLVTKKSGLPLGISGPIERRRKGRNVAHYDLQVTWPVHGGKPKNVHVYIGTENTFTEERLALAIEKAVQLRERNMRKFMTATTKSKREAAAAAGVVRSK